MISMLIFQKIHIKQILGNQISDRENVFAVILSDFKEEKPEFEA